MHWGNRQSLSLCVSSKVVRKCMHHRAVYLVTIRKGLPMKPRWLSLPFLVWWVTFSLHRPFFFFFWPFFFFFLLSFLSLFLFFNLVSLPLAVYGHASSRLNVVTLTACLSERVWTAKTSLVRIRLCQLTQSIKGTLKPAMASRFSGDTGPHIFLGKSFQDEIALKNLAERLRWD